MSSLIARTLLAAIASLVIACAALAQQPSPVKRQLPTGNTLPEERPGPTMVISLQEAVELAVLHNLDIEGARIDVGSATAGVTGARGEFDPVLFAFYQHRKDVEPQVSAVEATFTNGLFDTYNVGVRQKLYYGASYEVGFFSTRTLRSQNVGLTTAYQASAGFKYTQPLLRGLGRDANRRFVLEAINTSAISQQQFEAFARDVVRDTVRAYWTLVFAIEDLRVRRGSLGLAEELLRKNRIMVDVGTLAPLEITQAEAEVAQRQYDIINARAAVGAAADDLRRLLGVEEGSPSWDIGLVPADEAEYQEALFDQTETLTTAMSRRSELASADLSKQNAQLEVDAAKDARLPQLDLALTLEPAGLAGDLFGDANPLVDTDGDGNPTNDTDMLGHSDIERAWDQVSSWDFTSWSAALNYTQPLPNRAAKADLVQRRLDLEQRDLDIRKLRQQIILEVRQALRDLESARQRITAAGSARTLQERTLQAEVRKFENGLSTNFEVLTFQTDLQQAESAEVLARTDYLKALAEIKRARGTLLADYGLTPEP